LTTEYGLSSPVAAIDAAIGLPADASRIAAFRLAVEGGNEASSKSPKRRRSMDDITLNVRGPEHITTIDIASDSVTITIRPSTSSTDGAPIVPFPSRRRSTSSDTSDYEPNPR
jgi:hypothetical protein